MGYSAKIIVITAPSGSGKTTLVHRLLQECPALSFSISACTRAPRADEEHGRDYYFYSREDFETMVQKQAFVEWEMVYAGKYYGTLKSELHRIWDQGKTPLVDIDVKGALAIQKAYEKDCLSLFIQAPSLEVLRERLLKRGTETPESLEERVNKAKFELGFASYFDFCIINDQLEEAVVELKSRIQTFLDQPSQNSISTRRPLDARS